MLTDWESLRLTRNMERDLKLRQAARLARLGPLPDPPARKGSRFAILLRRISRPRRAAPETMRPASMAWLQRREASK